ncbi:MAG: hypothetical protein CL610_19595 [Anaerolineaceae bacterium]|nr:hypothetical protein [Anaerolineaceae bacterium]
MIYNYGAILHISEAGLEYIDEYDDVRFINFETCGQNAGSYVQSPTAQMVVARRVIQVYADGMILRTVEFFTRPETVFVLDSDQEFRQLRFRIEEMGWRIC